MVYQLIELGEVRALKVGRSFRIEKKSLGHVGGNPAFIYHRAFNPGTAEVEDPKCLYRKGKMGDVEVRARLISVLNAFLDPIGERRGCYAGQPWIIEEILLEDTKVTRAEAQKTLEMPKEAMGLSGPSIP